MMPKILLGAGHGGKDPGGGSCKYFLEKDKVLEISLYQEKRLKELGFEVEMIRRKDSYVSLSDRVALSKKFKPDVYISNHINAGGGDGAEVIHSIYSNGKLANMIANEIKEEGQNIRRVFSKKHPSFNADYYYLNRNTNCETLIVEYGFADSKGDDVDQLVNDWKDYAEAVLEATCLYLNVEYKKPSINEEWKLEGLKVLTEKGLLHNPEYWLDRLNESLPTWAIFNIISRIVIDNK